MTFDLKHHIKDKATAYVVGAVLTTIGIVFWGGVVAWFDMRQDAKHLLREEHTATIEAMKLEGRCNRYESNLSLKQARISAVNREQSKLRNYNRGAEPTDTNFQARVNTITDLESDKTLIVLEIGKLKQPTGCEDE